MIEVIYTLFTTEQPEICVKRIIDILTKGTSANLPYEIQPKFKIKEYDITSTEKDKYKVKLLIPEINISASIAMLLSYVAGEIMDLKLITGLKLMDIKYSDEVISKYQGPLLGIEQIRQRCNVYNRPLIGAIIKPVRGITIDYVLNLTEQLIKGGVDFIKDDELIADLPNIDFGERVKRTMDLIRKLKNKGYKIPLYAFNITSTVNKLQKNYECVSKNGGKCIMLNAFSTGLSVLEYVREFSELPIFVHSAFSACITRSGKWGISETLNTKILRLLGADFIIAGGINGKLYQETETVKDIVKTCTESMNNIKRCMPVLGGGQGEEFIKYNYKELRTKDFLYVSGGGIVGHKRGPSFAVKNMIEVMSGLL